MTTLFTPKGERPLWQLIYDELLNLDVADVLTYDRLDELIDGNFRANRSPLYKAAQNWGRERKRALAPVSGIGYRVVDAPEHEVLARSQHKRSKRALRRGRVFVETADRSRLSEVDRTRFDAMEINLSRQEEMIRRLQSKQERTDIAVARTQADTSKMQQRLTQLEETLSRHGIGLEAAS